MVASRTSGYPLEWEAKAVVRRELTHLADAESADLARVLEILRREFDPERIYVFGSQARGTPNKHSDVDLLVVVPDAGEHPYRLAQQAFRSIGPHALPLDILFMGSDDFAWRASVVTSLPATVLREGRLVYDSAS